MKKKIWFLAGLLSAITVGAFANLPSSGDTAGSIAPEAEVSEIRAKRQADLSFDQDLRHLSNLQGRYRENLPLRDANRSRDRIRVRQSSPRRVAPKKTSGKSSRRVVSPRFRVSQY